MSVEWRQYRARRFLRADENQRAIEELQKAALISWGGAQTQLLLARAQRRQGNLAGAAGSLQRAKGLGADPERARRETWLLWAQSGRIAEAQPHLADLLMDPRDDGPDICRAYVTGYLGSLRLGEAARLLDAWEKAYPEDAQAYFLRAYLMTALKRNEDAVAAYRRGLELAPGQTAMRCRLAYLLIDMGKLDEAGEHLRRCLAEEPRSPDVLLSWATWLSARDQVDQAAEALKQLLAVAPDHFEGQRLLGQMELARGRPQEAVRLLESAEKQRPYDRKCRYLLGRALEQLGRPAEAKPHLDYVAEATPALRRAEEQMSQVVDRPDDAQLRYEIGATLLKYGSPDDGARWLRTVLQLQPNHPGARRALAAYYRAHGKGQETLSTQKEASTPAEGARPVADWVPGASSPAPATVQAATAEIQRIAQRLLADFPRDPEALEQAGQIAFLFGHTAKAVEYWKKSLELAPRSAGVYRRLATVATRKGDQQEGLRLLRKAMDLDPRSFDNQFDLAEALMGQGRAAEAVGVLQKHVQMYPGSTRGYVLLGAAYLRRNALKEAKRAYEAAIKLDPLDDFPYSGLAMVCARLGDPQQAKRCREKSEQLRREHHQAGIGRREVYDDLQSLCKAMSRVYLNAGRLYYTEGKAGEAERIWLRAAAVSPEHVESRQMLARLYLRSGRAGDALRVFGQLARIAPADADYPFQIGRLYAASGQAEKAEAAWVEAGRRDPKGAASRAALAELYLKGNRKLPEAVALARKAADLEPTAPHYALLAAACRQAGDAPGALAALDMAVNIDPGNLQYREAYESLKKK